MVICTPFNKPGHFYYNQKINCMRASGAVRIGEEEYRFEPDSSFGVLDWGRGVWTYHNTWYWGSASGLVDGVDFGFNIGYGFGDTYVTPMSPLCHPSASPLSRPHPSGTPRCGVTRGDRRVALRDMVASPEGDKILLCIFDYHTAR